MKTIQVNEKNISTSISKNRQLAINIAASLVALAVSMGINFFLSPYIVRNVGVEAYGFIQLGNNFISYLAVLALALNSMSSRFISIEYFKGDIESANEYFSSTFYSNVILSIIFAPILIFLIINISILVNIPSNIILDVQFLFSFLAINFIIGLLTTNLGVSYYISNKLYLFSILQIWGQFFKAIIIIILFYFLKPYVFYVALATLLIFMITQLANVYWKNILIPELNINIKYFKFIKVKELIFSGIWNSVTRLGSMLSEGLDLLIANLMISALGMGILSIAKIIPQLITTVLYSLISTFLPNMTELYANQKQEELVMSVKQSMRIIGMIINIPIALLIAFGDILFTLWFPTQNAQLLHILSMLTIAPWAVVGQATILHNIFTIVNRIRLNSILIVATGFLNVLIVLIFLKTTDWGLYAVAGVSAVLSVTRNLLYTVPYGAKYINAPWYTFYQDIFKSVASVSVISAIGYIFKFKVINYNWLNLIILSSLLILIGLVFNFYLIYNKNERKFIVDKITAKVLRNR